MRLGISRHTVDARLRHALQILNVTSRREAAIIWRAAASAPAYQPFAYQPPEIAAPDATGDQSVLTWSEDGNDWCGSDSGERSGGAPWPPHAPALPQSPTGPGHYGPAAYGPAEVRDSVGWAPAGSIPADREPHVDPGFASPVFGFATPPHGPIRTIAPNSATPPVAARRFPRLWGGANELSFTDRLIGVLVVMILGMLAFGLLLSGIGALAQLRS